MTWEEAAELKRVGMVYTGPFGRWHTFGRLKLEWVRGQPPEPVLRFLARSHDADVRIERPCFHVKGKWRAHQYIEKFDAAKLEAWLRGYLTMPEWQDVDPVPHALGLAVAFDDFTSKGCSTGKGRRILDVVIEATK